MIDSQGCFRSHDQILGMLSRIPDGDVVKDGSECPNNTPENIILDCGSLQPNNVIFFARQIEVTSTVSNEESHTFIVKDVVIVTAESPRRLDDSSGQFHAV